MKTQEELNKNKEEFETLNTKLAELNEEDLMQVAGGERTSGEEGFVYCVCGAKYMTSSTKGSMRVNICPKCHPYFTGKKTSVDTEGRIDKFKKRYGIK